MRGIEGGKMLIDSCMLIKSHYIHVKYLDNRVKVLKIPLKVVDIHQPASLHLLKHTVTACTCMLM